MTTERFTTRNGVFYTDTKTGYEFQCYGEVVDIMNELAEENEQLKHRLAISEKANFVTTLEKENEHIKTTIKTMMENERTELGRSVLRQLWEAIQ